MTIVRPNKNQDIQRLITLLGVFLIATFLIGVFVYLNTVSLKHDLSKKRQSLERLKVENAELKSRFYGLVDAGNMEQVAVELGLVQDKNPQWLFASQF